MNYQQLMSNRHSVRQYLDKPLDAAVLARLEQETEVCNRESGLHIQLIVNEPKAFSGLMAHYGRFSGVSSYFALVGRKGPDLDEKCGYYGERLVLTAQALGLNTCWVALTYSKVKTAFTVGDGEKLVAVIALGYGETQGTAHRSKAFSDVSATPEQDTPDWYRNGIQAALLAPTAMNQQKFRFSLSDGNRVSAQPGTGFYTKMDLGIVKYHFELGAGREQFRWA